MGTKNNLKNTFKNLINDGATGIINIPAEEFGDWQYYSKFFAQIDGKNNISSTEDAPIVKIPDFDTFFPIYEEYISLARKYYKKYKEYDEYTDDGYDKFLTYTLLVSCTNYDFENFTDYVQKRIKMLKLAERETKKFITTYNNHKLYIQINKLSPNLEAPTQFTPILENQDGSHYLLPSISYGLYDDKAYIASVQGERGKQLGEAARKMDRYFRKLNNGIQTDEIEGEVSPSALASLTIFNAYLKSKNINKITAPSFMPLRAAAARTLLYSCEKDYSTEQFSKEIEIRDAQQYRATNKFMYLFPRYCYHFSESDCYFDDITQEMKTIIKNQSKENDNIIYDLDKICLDAFNTLSNSKQ